MPEHFDLFSGGGHGWGLLVIAVLDKASRIIGGTHIVVWHRARNDRDTSFFNRATSDAGMRHCPPAVNFVAPCDSGSSERDAANGRKYMVLWQAQ